MKQITIVTKNRDGLAADIAAVLGENDINIESLKIITGNLIFNNSRNGIY